MTRPTLAQSDTIIDAALGHGQAQGFKPLSVAVLNAGAHMVAFRRQA